MINYEAIMEQRKQECRNLYAKARRYEDFTNHLEAYHCVVGLPISQKSYDKCLAIFKHTEESSMNILKEAFNLNDEEESKIKSFLAWNS